MTRQELYQKYLCDCKSKCTGKVLEQCAAEFFKDLDQVIKGEQKDGAEGCSKDNCIRGKSCH